MLPRLSYKAFHGGIDMSYTTTQIRQNLFSIFDSLLERREEFLNNPLTDFTRKKKISFAQTMIFPMIAGANNLTTELLDLFGENDFPLASAMVQRRNQIKKEAFVTLFNEFTSLIPVAKTFLGYQLVACDGTRLNLPHNSSDTNTLVNHIEGRKSFNQIHLNALYDVMNDIFLDAEIQGMPEMDEIGAFCRFLDKYASSGLKRIYIADRLFGCFNVYAHAIHNDEKFLIRTKKVDAINLCRDCKNLMDAAFVDEIITIHIGRKRIKHSQRFENYHSVRKYHRYDYIEYGDDKVERLQLRVLKFPLANGTFEYIVTNLPQKEFSLDAIKELYNLRWCEETAFRHLKYAGNMVHIHSIKPDFLVQEIYGKLTMYNFSSCIEKAVEKTVGLNTTHDYKTNHTQMQKFVRRFLIGMLHDLEKLIKRFRVPVRPGRKFKRILRRQSAVPLAYR